MSHVLLTRVLFSEVTRPPRQVGPFMTFTFWRARQYELMLSRTCDELTNTRLICLAAGSGCVWTPRMAVVGSARPVPFTLPPLGGRSIRQQTHGCWKAEIRRGCVQGCLRHLEITIWGLHLIITKYPEHLLDKQTASKIRFLPSLWTFKDPVLCKIHVTDGL